MAEVRALPETSRLLSWSELQVVVWVLHTELVELVERLRRELAILVALVVAAAPAVVVERVDTVVMEELVVATGARGLAPLVVVVVVAGLVILHITTPMIIRFSNGVEVGLEVEHLYLGVV